MFGCWIIFSLATHLHFYLEITQIKPNYNTGKSICQRDWSHRQHNNRKLCRQGLFFFLKTQRRLVLKFSNVTFTFWKTCGNNDCKCVMPSISNETSGLITKKILTYSPFSYCCATKLNMENILSPVHQSCNFANFANLILFSKRCINFNRCLTETSGTLTKTS